MTSIIACVSCCPVIITSDNIIYYKGSSRLRGYSSGSSSSYSEITNNTNKIPINITNCFDGTVVIMDDGSLYGVGYNQYYQLGIGTQTSIYTLTSISLPTNRTAVSVHGGYMYLIVLMDDGSLYGCGLNNNGQLGLGDTNNKNVLTQIPLPSGKTISSIKCAMQYFAILMTDGTIYGTGRSPILGNYNKDVKTSLTQVNNNTGKTPVSFAISESHLTVIMSDNSLMSLGNRNYYSTGIYSLNSKNYFEEVNNTYNKSIRNPVYVECGKENLTVIMDDNSIWACGKNSNYEVGDGTNAIVSTLKRVYLP